MTAAGAAITITTGSATRLMIGGREAPISSRKSMAMLVYIALQPDQVESRERLAARLWSDSGPDHARAALRQTLRRLILDLGAGRRPGRGRPQRHPPDPSGDARHRRGPARGRPRHRPAAAGRPGGRSVAHLRRLRGHRPRVQPLDRGAARAAGLAARRQARRRRWPRPATETEHAGASPRRWRGSTRPTRAPAGRRCRRTWRSATPRRRCAATSGSGRCSRRSSTSSRRRRRKALYVAIKQGQLQPRLPRPRRRRPRTCWRRSPSSSSRSRRSSCPGPSATSAPIFRDEMIGALVAVPRLAGHRRRAGRPRRRRPTAPTSCASACTAATTASWWRCGSSTRPTASCIWSERQTATLEGMAALHRTALRHLAVALNVHLSAPRLQSAREVAEPDGAQVRALDAGAGADGRMAGRERQPRRGDPARPRRHHARLRPGDGGAGADPARPADRLSRRAAAAGAARGVAGADLAGGEPRPARFAHASLPRLEPRHRRHARRGAQPPRSRARPQRERPLDDHLGGARLRLRRRDRAGARPGRRRPGPSACATPAPPRAMSRPPPI